MNHTTATKPETTAAPVDAGYDSQRLCLVVGGEPAYDFATKHGLPVRTYCGDWLYPDVLDQIEATVSPTVDCAACDLARAKS